MVNISVTAAIRCDSPQPGTLRFGWMQDGRVRIGIFSETEEIGRRRQAASSSAAKPTGASLRAVWAICRAGNRSHPGVYFSMSPVGPSQTIHLTVCPLLRFSKPPPPFPRRAMCPNPPTAKNGKLRVLTMFRVGDRVRIKMTANVDSYYRGRPGTVSAGPWPDGTVDMDFVEDSGTYNFEFADLEPDTGSHAGGNGRN
jgi:hypothetical protein